jgi:hydrogenase-4 membrane subunit HyfE
MPIERIIALAATGVLIVAVLMFHAGISKRDKRLIIIAAIYSIVFVIGLVISRVLNDNEESKSERFDTVQATYETTVIDGTEYELVPKYQTTVINGAEYKLVPSD